MAVHEIEPRYQYEKPVRAAQKTDTLDDDLRRLVLSMFHLLRRRYPNDFRRIMAEMSEAKTIA